MTFRAHHLLVTFDEDRRLHVPCGLTVWLGARTIILADLRFWDFRRRSEWPHDWRDKAAFDAPISRSFHVGPVEVRRMRWAHR